LPIKYVRVGEDALHLVHTGATTLPDVPPALDRGALLLFLHGADGNAGQWRSTLASLGGAHSGLAIDLPGHGRSTGLLGLAGCQAYADAVIALARTLHLRPVVVVGHGFGATVALGIAARAPELVRALVLVGASLVPRLPESLLGSLRDVVRGRQPRRLPAEALSPAASPDVVREAWIEMAKTDPRVALRDYESWNATDAAALVARARRPALVVCGAADRLTPPADAEALAAALPGAQTAVVDGAGHLVQLERGAALAERACAFAGDAA
jgi:pimeloyl-ACP methyl ester carboxylesterase